MNTSVHDSTLYVTADHRHVHVITFLICILFTSWTIGANIVILVCFYRNRRRRWTGFSRQVCSMTIGDMCVGFTAVPILVMEISPADAYTFRCLTTFYLFLSTQSVALLHVLGICVFRNLSVISISETNQTSHQIIYSNCVIALSWLLSLGVMLTPFLAWSNVGESQKLCYINNLFGYHHREGMVFIGCFFCISQGLTNIIYIITCVRLRRELRSIVPVHQDITIATVSDTVTATIDPGRSTQRTSVRFTPANTSPVITPHVSQLSQPLAAILKSQKQVVVTIGILLLMFNVFTLPFTVVFFVERSQPLDRNVRFLSAILFMMNSGLNPIVYAMRIKSVKGAIKALFRDIFRVPTF